jgi:CheY-like chemotaxis protein
MRILIADDDQLSRSLVVQVLRRPGVDIVEADDGAQVVSLLASRARFDLVVTDYLMPWMNGLQLAATLRAHGNELPILLMTGAVSRDLEVRVAQLPRVAMLKKPFDIAQLRAAVDRLAAVPV